MNIRICLLPGDGIGPEIVNQAVGVLDRVAAKFGHTITTTSALIGGIAIDTTGIPLPEETITQCQKADAILLGAVGGPKWDTIDPAIRRKKDCWASARHWVCLPICGQPPCLRNSLLHPIYDLILLGKAWISWLCAS